MTDSLLQVMSIFNFASDGFTNHPLRKPEFYNDITEALCKALDLPISNAAHRISRVKHDRVGMPLYMQTPQISERYVIEIEIHNPFGYIYSVMPDDMLSVSPKIPYIVRELRQHVIKFTNSGLINNVSAIINNMKVYYNMFYGRIDADGSIIRHIGDSSAFEFMSSNMLDLINRCAKGLGTVLYYDTDTIYVNDVSGSEDILEATITDMRGLGITVSYVKYDNLIIPSKKNIVKFNGEPIGLRCISPGDVTWRDEYHIL